MCFLEATAGSPHNMQRLALLSRCMNAAAEAQTGKVVLVDKRVSWAWRPGVCDSECSL